MTRALLDPDDRSGSEELAAALATALAPLAPPPAHAAALREDLLARARASRDADLAYRDRRLDEGHWHALGRGVRVKTLCADAGAVLVELAPGASLPAHGHHAHEECIVLRGQAQLGEERVSAGDYHVAPAGSRHGRVSAPTGALLYLRGTPLGDGLGVARDLLAAWLPGGAVAPHTVRAADGEWHELAPGVALKALWRPPEGGASAQLLRLAAGARLAAPAAVAGEECLLLDGEAFFGDTLLRAGDHRHAPAGAPPRELASDVGALIFVHGGAFTAP